MADDADVHAVPGAAASYDPQRAMQALDQISDMPLSAIGVFSNQQLEAQLGGMVSGAYYALRKNALDAGVGDLDQEPPQHHYGFQQQIAMKLARFSAKPQSVPGGKRIAQEMYKLEKIDPKHRVGFILSWFLEHYQQKPNPQVSFFQWLDLLSTEQVRQILGEHVHSPEGLNRVAEMFTKGVDFLDAASRITYSVSFGRGAMQWMGKTLDTANMETKFSGAGWGIWVLSPAPTQIFYTNSHKLGEFHHSSFLQGKKVTGAGEWQVTNGKLAIISGKTGHYQCGPDELANSLQALLAMGVNLMRAKVKVYDASSNIVLLNAHEFMANESLRAAYKTDAHAAAPTGAAPAGRNFTIKPKRAVYS